LISVDLFYHKFFDELGVSDEEEELSVTEDIGRQTANEHSHVYDSLAGAIHHSQFSFDEIGNFLAEHAVRLRLDIHKVIIAYTNWLGSPSPFIRNKHPSRRPNDCRDAGRIC
jgi:hypothetical protein